MEIGVRMTFLPRYSEENAAAAPECSVPAIGCPGTKRGNAAPSDARAAAMTSCLVLPASVTIVAAPRCGAIVANSAAICPTGAASSTTSASRSSACQGCVIVYVRSVMPNRCADSRLARLLPTPTTLRTAPTFLSASANEPPISPTPTTMSLANGRAGTPSASQRSPQCCEKALVLGRQAHRYAQVLGQSVIRDWPHDHALTQQRFVCRRRLAHMHEQEVCVRRNIRHAHRVESTHQLREAGAIQARAFRNVVGIRQ